MSAEIMHGDCLTVLPSLAAKSVQTCVTSPPYWGLRDYGTAKWEGGDNACAHIQRMARGDAGRVSSDDRVGVNPSPVSTPMQFRGLCGHCGAERIDAQLGLEKTPDEYVAKMVETFREVRRVLRDDGTLWLNLGDSYAAGKLGRDDMDDDTLARRAATYGTGRGAGAGPRDKPIARSAPPGLKPKDLVGIPWRTAFALQADGWYLRSDIIWHKPNPMPESVTDRPTKAHEYLFLLTKSPTYYYDADAVREPITSEASVARNRSTPRKVMTSSRADGVLRGDYGREFACKTENGRNRRSVWTVATRPYKGAHFATFPPALIEPCILAGSKPGDTVLDPFGGSGTTAAVATRHNRNAISIELNAAYLPLQHERLAKVQPTLGVA